MRTSPRPRAARGGRGARAVTAECSASESGRSRGEGDGDIELGWRELGQRAGGALVAVCRARLHGGDTFTKKKVHERNFTFDFRAVNRRLL